MRSSGSKAARHAAHGPGSTSVGATKEGARSAGHGRPPISKQRRNVIDINGLRKPLPISPAAARETAVAVMRVVEIVDRVSKANEPNTTAGTDNRSHNNELDGTAGTSAPRRRARPGGGRSGRRPATSD